MDKTQKLEYQQQIDAYMERNQIYDLLQGLLKVLLQVKPKEPLDFLISRLAKPQPKRVFIVGPPGSEKYKIAEGLASEFNCALISMKRIFERQISKKTPASQRIELALASSCPLDNETVIGFILQKLKKHEAKGKNSIVAGFPMNVIQALSLQSKGIIPDKLFVLKSSFEVSYEKALGKFKASLPEGNHEALANKVITEYYMNMGDVMNAYKDFYCEIDASKDIETIKAEMARILKITFMGKYARRPPRILVVGPPGAGKTTIATLLAKKYRLACVSAEGLLEQEIKTKSSRGQIATEKGETVMDAILGKLVEARLNQPDCKVSGWVLEGFPMNEVQAKIFRQGNFMPSLVVELELEDETIFGRVEGKRVDPNTGKVYSLTCKELRPEVEVASRLVAEEGLRDKVERRLEQWKNFRGKLLDEYKQKVTTVSTEKSTEAVMELISEAIEH